MPAFAYAGFLQTLAIAIISSLWQAALVWLCYSACKAFIKLSSSKKYLLAVVSELFIFILFIVSLVNNLYFSQVHQTKIFRSVINFSNKNWLHKQVLPIISFAYLIVLAGIVAKWIFNFYSTQKIYSSHLISVETQWQQWIEEKAKKLNIKKRIQIFAASFIHVPITLGIFKPVILLPIAIANYLTVDELEAILLHELAHIKRSDYLINILLSLIETVLYFNPFVFYFKKIIKKERENICDDEVLLQHYNPVQYAESLLKLAKFSLNKKEELAFAMSASAGNNSQLLQRIQRITKTKVEQKNKLFSFTLLAAIMLAALSLFYPSSNILLHNKKITTTNLPAIIPSSNTEKNIVSSTEKKIVIKKNRQKKLVQIPKNKTDESLIIALETLKQITIPGLENNIEEYRKTLSGKDAQQLTDDNLKQKIKDYVSVKNISINDFIKKIDSVKLLNKGNYFNLPDEENKNLIIPASYINKNSLDEYIKQHQQIKHFIVLTNTENAPYYLIIRIFNNNKEPVFIFIPYTPKQTAD